MADLPSYVIVRMAGYSEEFDPSVERTEMERGMAKQRVLNTRVVVNLRLTLLMETTQQAEDFLDWYHDVIGRIGFFNFRHPRTGQTISGRFPGGQIGTLQSATNTNYMWQRDVVIEYLR